VIRIQQTDLYATWFAGLRDRVARARIDIRIRRLSPKAKIRTWDPAEHLITDEDMAAYLEAALQEGDSALIAAALGDIARAKGMTQIARDAGLGRESLYKALSADGNPEFSTIMKVVAALGLRLHASPARVGG
jgi:probable addiction module antidote protein